MELRPGYKKTEIGVIPEDWEVASIGSAADFLNNQRRPVKDADRAKMQGEYPYYGAAGILDHVNDFIFDDDLVLIGEDGENILSRNLPVAFRVSGKCWVNNHAHVLKPKAHVDTAFFAMACAELDLAAHNSGTAQPKITKATCEHLDIPLPQLPEQKVIAEALSDVDASIAAVSRLIAKKRDLRQGAMQRLLTGQTRLPGFTAPWQEKRLGDHVAFLKNGVQSRAQLTLDDPVRYLHYGDIHVSTDLCLDLSNPDMPRLPSSTAAGLTRLQDGDIVFVDASEDLNGVGKSLEIVGAIGVEAVSGQHTIAARFDKFVLADGFKRYLQFIPAFTTHLRRLAAGTKVYATNRKHIASAELDLPETDEQIAIARVLSDTELEISALETRLAKTRALKQAMMQALLTGRVRLPFRRDAAPQTKEAVHV